MFRAVCGSDARRISYSYGIVNLIEWGSIALLVYEDIGYLTSPSRRDPQKKYIPKGDGTPEKTRGGFLY